MSIKPYKQACTDSCLAACMLMLKEDRDGLPFDEEMEREIWVRGLRRKHAFHIVGIPKEFRAKFRMKMELFVDNAYFAKALTKAFGAAAWMRVAHAKITIPHIRDVLKRGPIICNLNVQVFGSYSHAPHFVILEKELSKERVLLVDPWTGKKHRVRVAILEEAIGSLKNHLKICPLLLRMIG